MPIEHTLLVTEDGVEVLTARLESSPGGPVHRLETNGSSTIGTNGSSTIDTNGSSTKS